jgi:hypothetical protein
MDPEGNKMRISEVTGRIKQFLDDRIALEQDPAREGPMSDFPDKRFDACLYLIGPTTWGHADLANIRELSKLVPVIPLLAKVMHTPSSPLPCVQHLCGHKCNTMSTPALDVCLETGAGIPSRPERVDSGFRVSD